MKLNEIKKSRIRNIWEPRFDLIDVSRKSLDTLDGSPQIVNGSFVCAHNHLTSLMFGPREVTGTFNCSHNKITNLRYAPEKVGAMFNCSNNRLTNLHDIHKIIKYCHKMNVSDNNITGNVLGLLLIQGLTRCWLTVIHHERLFHVETIINKYLGMSDKDSHTKMLECQDELIENGLEPFARL